MTKLVKYSGQHDRCMLQARATFVDGRLVSLEPVDRCEYFAAWDGADERTVCMTRLPVDPVELAEFAKENPELMADIEAIKAA